MTYKSIFTAGVARYLLRLGNPIYDIKPDKNNKDKVDIISAFIRLAFSYKQIYTKIAVSSDASSVKIIFSFAAMNTGNWRFKTKAMGNNPWKGGLTMEIVH